MPLIKCLQLKLLFLFISTINADVCIPPMEKGDPGPPGKPGVCGCELIYMESIKEQMNELLDTVKILNTIVTPRRLDLDIRSEEIPVEEEDIDCAVPASPENGLVYSASGTASTGENIVVRCRKTFYMDVNEKTSETKMTCREDGSWNKRVPYCYATVCLVPHTPPSVTPSTSLREIKVSANLTFRCSRGYEIRGTDGLTERTVTCKKNGNWTDRPPNCVRSYCGVGFRDGRVRDEQISASSYHNSDWLPYCARLDKETLVSSTGGTWLPGRNYRGEWILVDLIVPTLITGVITQGYPDRPWWVSGFTISFGNTSTTLHVIQGDRGPKMFEANPSEGNDHFVNRFRKPIKARYFRLTVESYVNDSPTLRMDYLTC